MLAKIDALDVGEAIPTDGKRLWLRKSFRNSTDLPPMKDIVENRKRLGLATKARMILLLLRENGILWTSYMVLYYAASAIAEACFGWADARRRKWGLPGVTSPAMSKLIWQSWDWSSEGEEWTPSSEWKESVFKRLLRANIPEGSVVLEIGPGGGRWTEELQRRSRFLIGLDISQSCVAACRARFAHCSNVDFRLGSGSDLEGIDDASIDAVWSFDVFVHVNRSEFQAYTEEIARVLRPGGVGLIQHGSVGGSRGGWRSDVSTEDVRTMVRAANLDLVEQISSWLDNGREYQAGLYGDVVTIFAKPAVQQQEFADRSGAQPLEPPNVSG